MSRTRPHRRWLLTGAVLAGQRSWARRRADEAQIAAGRQVSDALAEADLQVSRARAEAHQQISEARAEADRHVSEARAEADRRVRAAELTAAEHAEQHRLVGMVARGASLTDVGTGVARAGVLLLGGQVGLVVRLDNHRGEIVGRHLKMPLEGYPAIGEFLRFDPASAIGQVLATGRTARAHQGAASPFASALGQRVAAPISLGGELWGAVAVSSVPGRTLPDDAEARLLRFAELIALAIGNAEARRRLILAASTDALTGLANHRAFQTRLEDEVARAHRQRQPLSLALIDIDHFKQVNDTFGHLAGDRVLAELANRLRANMRGDVLLARIGGDEFAAVLPLTDGAEAAELSARLHEMVRDAPVDEELQVTVSIGVSELVEGGDAHDLRQRADDALYAAKRGGRNAVRSQPVTHRVDDGDPPAPEAEGAPDVVSHPAARRPGLGLGLRARAGSGQAPRA